MPVKKKSSDNGVDSIRRLQTINDVLNKGSLENLLAYGSAKDNEAASENAADNLINQIASDRKNNRDITIIESLTKEGPRGESITKKKSVTFASEGSKKPRMRRDVHLVKHVNPKPKKSGKAASSKKVKGHKR
ncbi:MAG: hypothetical protein ACP5MZ_01865 [Candidatus Micrarchaeia archaeon]